MPDSTLTFINDFNDIKPKYGMPRALACGAMVRVEISSELLGRMMCAGAGANEFVAVNPETDEEGFYLAQLREDVFAKVQSVVHVLWLEPKDEKTKTVWEFDEYDSIPCGSIICRVTLKVPDRVDLG